MRIRTYRAADLASALAEASAELGPEALVLSTRSVDDGIEITVAIRPRDTRRNAGATLDAASSGTPAPARDDLARVAREVTRLRDGRPAAGSTPADGTLGAAATRRDAAPPIPAHAPVPVRAPMPAPARSPVRAPIHSPAKSTGLPGPISAAAAALVRDGLSPDLAARFALIAARDLRGELDPAALAAAAERGIGGLMRFVPPPLHARELILVGPPGVGKSTTAAKLAARLLASGDRAIVIADADVERVGAWEQSTIYARHLGVGLERVSDPQQMQRVRREHAGATLIVDTAGVGRNDLGRLRELDVLRRGLPGAEVVLLVPAGLHRDEARAVVERFALLRPTCAAIARVDDGGRVGDVVSALAPAELPLSFVTNGYRVPDDLEDASPRGLAALMLRAGRAAARSGERIG